ncbi:MAG: hypothetical protein KBT18_09015 [Comamonas sp.]|nr:hypothetical protein [Candidatus Comamonas equi]
MIKQRVMRAQPCLSSPHTKTGAARLRNLLLCKALLAQSQSLQRPAALIFYKPTQHLTLQGHAFSCSASGTRSLDFRRFARRRCAVHAIACSHLLKTPRYLLGHT